MQVRKKCIVCGNEFIADRRTAKYCSKKCHTRSKSIKAHEDAIEQRTIKQKEKSTQPETIEPCKHPRLLLSQRKEHCPYLRLHTANRSAARMQSLRVRQIQTQREGKE